VVAHTPAPHTAPKRTCARPTRRPKRACVRPTGRVRAHRTPQTDVCAPHRTPQMDVCAPHRTPQMDVCAPHTASQTDVYASSRTPQTDAYGIVDLCELTLGTACTLFWLDLFRVSTLRAQMVLALMGLGVEIAPSFVGENAEVKKNRAGPGGGERGTVAPKRLLKLLPSTSRFRWWGLGWGSGCRCGVALIVVLGDPLMKFNFGLTKCLNARIGMPERGQAESERGREKVLPQTYYVASDRGCERGLALSGGILHSWRSRRSCMAAGARRPHHRT
jgi:hypothetical protein